MQTQSKAKVLIPISGNIFVRNFIHSGAFDLIESHYNVTYVADQEPAERIRASSANRKVMTIVSDPGNRRALFRYKLGYLTMRRYRSRSRSFELKYQGTLYNHLSFFKKILFNLASLPLVCELAIALGERKLGYLSDLEKVVALEKPDFMIIPSGFSDSLSIDALKTARRHAIPDLTLMFNWDNVSCKGTLPVLPEHLAVWGTQTAEQAFRIHRFKAHQVHVLGSPQFETYFNLDSSTLLSTAAKEKILSDSGVSFPKETHSLTKPTVILYLGISRFRDEISLLDSLENAIATGKLENTKVIYRPHPWKEMYPNELSFFDRNYRFISMDAQMSTHYQRMFAQHRDPKNSPYDLKSFVPDYAYAPKILGAVDAVISSLTTMGIEAMIMGKPVLLPAFPDPKFKFSVDTLIQYDHHNCWERFSDAILCKREDQFISDIQRLLVLANDPAVSQRTKRDVQYVVYGEQKPYKARLFSLVQELFPTFRVLPEKTSTKASTALQNNFLPTPSSVSTNQKGAYL